MIVAFRPYDPRTDVAFLYAAWIGSYEKSPWAGIIPSHASYTVTKAAIAMLLARGMKVTMAVNPDDDQQIIGFIAFEPGLLHYVFVKDLFRRQGVAKLLMASADFVPGQPTLHTFKTADARYLGKLIHRPGLARRKQAYP